MKDPLPRGFRGLDIPIGQAVSSAESLPYPTHNSMGCDPFLSLTQRRTHKWLMIPELKATALVFTTRKNNTDKNSGNMQRVRFFF